VVVVAESPSTRAREKAYPVTCQAQTLLKKNPTPSTASPRKDSAMATKAMAHALR
jgi:hypothetical protein